MDNWTECRYVLVAMCLSACVRGCHGEPVSALVPLMAQSDSSPPANQHTPGCWFGEGRFYQLQESWNPVLEPMGKMVCIACTCHPVFKKGRLSQEGNVDCQNIAPGCPKLQCQSAYLPEGECCKRCTEEATDSKPRLPLLGGGGGLSMGAGGMAMGDQAGANNHDFLALLVGKSRRTRVRTRAVGSGRFTLVGQDLTYALHLSRLSSPRTVRFVEEHGTLLHEVTLTSQDLHPDRHSTYKICGTWSDMPSIYSGYLQAGKLHVVVTSEARPQGELGGPVRPHRALVHETWSTVLSPARRDGSGALAIMTLEHSGSLGFLVLHSGVGERKRDVNATLFFTRKQKALAQFPVTIPPEETETAEIWMEPPNSVMKSFVRGRVQFALGTNHRVILRGEILPKLTCNVLHAILTVTEASSATKDQEWFSREHNSLSSKRKEYTISNRSGYGVAVTLELTTKGKIDYHIKTGAIQSITKLLVQEITTLRRNKPICLVQGRSIRLSGSCGSVQADQIQQLFHGQLSVTMETGSSQQPALSGPLRQALYYHDSFQSGEHVALTGAAMHPPVSSGLVGHAWLSVSTLCQVHFTVILDGLGESQDLSWTPFLRDRLSGDTFVTVSNTGSMANGVIQDLPSDFYKRLTVGLVIFGVSTTLHPDGEISSNVTLLSSCVEGRPELQETPLNDDQTILGEEMSSLPHSEGVMTITQCSSHGIVYEDGQTWIPVDDACATCSCSRGNKHCEPVLCPAAMCLNPIAVPGECCPHCPSESSLDFRLSEDTCYFEGDKRQHRVGTVFHPYVMPFGYQKCAVCSCSSAADDVVCAQLPCPDLPCAASDAVRLNPDDCCKVCPDGASVLQEQAVDENPFTNVLNMQTACSYRGQMYEDGSQWHPRLASFSSAESCVTCHCRAGKVSCAREECGEPACAPARRVRLSGQCCATCLDS